MKILTPLTSEALVASMQSAGYDEVVESYPLALETPNGFLFVAHEPNCTDDGAEMFVLSEWNGNDYRWVPHNEFETFPAALDEFNSVLAGILTA